MDSKSQSIFDNKITNYLKIALCGVFISLINIFAVLLINDKFSQEQPDALFTKLSLKAANDISKLYIFDERLGYLGLKNTQIIDSHNSNKEIRIFSFRYMHKLLNEIDNFANDMHYQYLHKLVQSDENKLNNLEKVFYEAIARAFNVSFDTKISFDSYIDVNENDLSGSIYADILKLYLKDKINNIGNLQSLSFSLKKKIFDSPHFFANTDKTFSFINQNKIALDKHDLDVLCIEANLKRTINKNYDINEMISKKVNIYFIDKTLNNSDSLFIINFPNGIPSSNLTINDFFVHRYISSKHNWYQVYQNSFPEKGLFSPPLDFSYFNNSASQAVQTSLYNWLLKIGYNLNYNQLEKYFNSKLDLINTSELGSNSIKIYSNSGLCRDSKDYDSILIDSRLAKNSINNFINSALKYDNLNLLPQNCLSLLINNGTINSPFNSVSYPKEYYNFYLLLVNNIYSNKILVNKLKDYLQNSKIKSSDIPKIILVLSFIERNIKLCDVIYNNLFSLSKEGIKKISYPIDAYLVGNKFCVVPSDLSLEFARYDKSYSAIEIDTLLNSLLGPRYDFVQVFNTDDFRKYIKNFYNINLNLEALNYKSEINNFVNPFNIAIDSQSLRHNNSDDLNSQVVILKSFQSLSHIKCLPENSRYYNSHSCCNIGNSQFVNWSLNIVDLNKVSKNQQQIIFDTNHSYWYLSFKKPLLSSKIGNIITVYMPMLTDSELDKFNKNYFLPSLK